MRESGEWRREDECVREIGEEGCERGREDERKSVCEIEKREGG